MLSVSRAKLDDLVLNLWTKARQPAAGIAIMSKGETVYSNILAGDGKSELSDQGNAPLFHIASISKSFNATMLAMLVDAGTLSWDRPVIEYVPDFQMMDEEVAKRCTLRDLVVMRTGLPRHDMAWVGRHCTRADLFRGLQYLQPANGFRAKFEYNNITATIAGHVAERVTGETWENLIIDRIFNPLGMARSGCNPFGATVQPLHEDPTGAIVPSTIVATTVTGPSGGSIVSSLPDMLRWASFNLSRGISDGKRLLSERAIDELHRPQIGIGKDFPRFNGSGCYGLGWFVDHYRGYKRVSHEGHLHDLNSDLTLFPELDLAIINYCSFGSNAVAPYVSQDVFDAIMGYPNGSSVQRALEEYSEQLDALKADTSDLKIAIGDPDQYVRPSGHFAHPGYGTMSCVLNDTGIAIRLNDDLKGEFISIGGNLWRVAKRQVSMKWPDPFRWPCEIEAAVGHDRSTIVALRIKLEPHADSIEFLRQD